MNLLAQNDPAYASGYLRIHLPAKHLLKDFNVIPLQSPYISADYFDWADVIWHQTPINYNTMPFLQYGSKKIMDCDDVQEFGLYKSDEVKSHKLNMFYQNFKIADKVIVGNEFMKEYYAKRKDNPVVMGEYLDPCVRKWDNQKHNDNKFRIVWAGADCYNEDIKEINDLFEKTHKKYPQVEFTLIGFGEKYACDYVKHIPFIDHHIFGEKLAEVGADLAINHLSDRDVNLAKTNIKWLEYSWLGIPSLLSERYYKDMIPGAFARFCKNTDEYVEEIGRIIKDGDNTMGKEAQRYVKQ